jgi:hypothetical protein
MRLCVSILWSVAVCARPRSQHCVGMQVQKLIDQFHKGDLTDKSALSWEGFAAYFASPLAFALEPAHKRVYQA